MRLSIPTQRMRPGTLFCLAWILYLSILVGVRFASGQEYSVHQSRLPAATTVDPDQVRVTSHLYTLAINPKTKIADWACYRATAADHASRNSIERRWINALGSITLEHQDYRGDRYDMGHLVPLGTFKASIYAWELNWVGNIAPQTPELNRGCWNKLEQRIRDLTQDHEYVDVCVGPLYERKMAPLDAADEPHTVPSHYWCLVRPKDSEASAYIMPQAIDSKADPDRFRVSLQEIERRTALDFGVSDG